MQTPSLKHKNVTYLRNADQYYCPPNPFMNFGFVANMQFAHSDDVIVVYTTAGIFKLYYSRSISAWLAVEKLIFGSWIFFLFLKKEDMSRPILTWFTKFLKTA